MVTIINGADSVDKKLEVVLIGIITKIKSRFSKYKLRFSRFSPIFDDADCFWIYKRRFFIKFNLFYVQLNYTDFLSVTFDDFTIKEIVIEELTKYCNECGIKTFTIN